MTVTWRVVIIVMMITIDNDNDDDDDQHNKILTPALFSNLDNKKRNDSESGGITFQLSDDEIGDDSNASNHNMQNALSFQTAKISSTTATSTSTSTSITTTTNIESDLIISNENKKPNNLVLIENEPSSSSSSSITPPLPNQLPFTKKCDITNSNNLITNQPDNNEILQQQT